MPPPKRPSPKPSPPPTGACDCGPFFLDVIGSFTRRQVRLTWTNAPRPSTPQIDHLIDRAWHHATDLARRTSQSLYDGRLCRLIDYRLTPRTFCLTAGPVSFREFLGTNCTNPQIIHIAGPQVLANPLGISAAVITTDGFIILGRRSSNVAWHAGMIHPIGGIAELTDAGRPPSPFDAIAQELREELGTSPARTPVPLCLGMVRDKALLQPELIFRLKVPADARSLRASASQASDAHENAELIAVRDRSTSVVSFIERRADQTTPITLATLLLHGLNRWGSGWFTTTRGYLRKLI